MYLVGAPHPHKNQVIERVTELLSAREGLVTSAETFQEIIHRYKAIRDPKHLNVAYQALEAMVSRVESVTKADTDMARSFSIEYDKLSSRDCLHVAVMKKIGCHRIWTYDRMFAEVPFVTRIE